jgi:tripartite tricarboxylate transporter TctB family protein
MSNLSPAKSRHQYLRELAVPAIMIGGIGLYLYDSMHLSAEALAFPAVLIVVIVIALLWALISYFVNPSPLIESEPSADEDEAGPILDPKPWLLVALPALLVAAFDFLGVLTALVVLVLGGQAIFGLRSPLKSLLIAIAVVAPTYIVFKYFLYARFPAGVFGLG